ncbi:hypothetical protein, partial [Staphylococcus aureus]
GRVLAHTLDGKDVIGVQLETEMEFVFGVDYTFMGINADGSVVETQFNASGITDTILFNAALLSLTPNSIFIITDDN